MPWIKLEKILFGSGSIDTRFLENHAHKVLEVTWFCSVLFDELGPKLS